MTALLLAGLVLLLATAAVLAVTGDLTQPAGTAGCISETGAGPCADRKALVDANSVAVSPDGKSVYVASSGSYAVARFTRNTTTGAISQPTGSAACISEGAAPPDFCAFGHGLDHPTDVAVSPDGKSVYVASSGSDAVARFTRNTTTGAISQPSGSAGCISETGAGPCANGHGLDFAQGVTVSPDGKSVYVASSNSGAVVRIVRNTTTGAISQPAGTAGCISETGAGPCTDGHRLDAARAVAVSPDGKSVYVASFSNAVVRINRNTTTGAIGQPAGTAGCVSEAGSGGCANGHALSGAQGVAVSPDGKSVYVASFLSGAVARFNRNTTTGAISQPAGSAGCVSDTGAAPCANGRALLGAADVALAPDGKSVYVASSGAAVARFNRNTTGGIGQPVGITGCISESGTEPCANGHALKAAQGVAVAPDGKSVYVASSGSDAVARLNRAP